MASTTQAPRLLRPAPPGEGRPSGLGSLKSARVVPPRRRAWGEHRVAASMGGGGGRSPFGQQSGLILPGQGGGGMGNMGNMGNGSAPAPYLPFMRPSSDSQSKLSSEDMLDILRERRGMWYDFAPYITELTRQGMSPSLIAEITGIQGSEQATIVVASQVHATLREAGCKGLPYFDVGGAEVLYELRVLSANRRCDAAEYVAARNFDGKGAREVARAMKEHERRKREDGWDAFGISPADCLAYAFYRQSKEARSTTEQVSLMEKALECAESESAKAKVADALARATGAKGAKPAVDNSLARVPTVRLRYDETFPKPIPIVGSLHKLSPGSFQEAVSRLGFTRMQGPFEVFAAEKDSLWMAVPAWPALVAASGKLAGVIVEDTNDVPSLRGREVLGPLVVVADVTPEAVGSSKPGLFLVGDGEGVCLAGAQASGERLGKIIVAILPPKPGDGGEEYDVDD